MEFKEENIIIWKIGKSAVVTIPYYLIKNKYFNVGDKINITFEKNETTS